MSLKNLIALQAKKQATESTRPAPASVQPTAPVEAESPKQEPATLPAAPAKKGLGLNTASGFKKPAASAAPAKPSPKPAPIQNDVFSLEDLASMDAGTVAPVKEATTDSG